MVTLQHNLKLNSPLQKFLTSFATGPCLLTRGWTWTRFRRLPTSCWDIVSICRLEIKQSILQPWVNGSDLTCTSPYIVFNDRIVVFNPNPFASTSIKLVIWHRTMRDESLRTTTNGPQIPKKICHHPI